MKDLVITYHLEREKVSSNLKSRGNEACINSPTVGTALSIFCELDVCKFQQQERKLK